MTTSSDTEVNPLPPGTLLRGKWHGKTYRLEKLIGLGANGQVYLATSNGYKCAVKLGLDAADLQGEANILAALDHAEKKRRPFLLDVDDALIGGREVPFYIMRFVPGVPVNAFLQKHGAQWVGVVGYRLLERLVQLHEAGWVFGDIKSDNVLVGEYGKLELVDYGGMSAIGRSVRQFTEIYDRGYWSAGGRTADAAYDWFSVGMLWLHALDRKRLLHLTKTLLPQNRNPEELMKLVRSNSRLKPLESWLEKAFSGRFEDTRDAAKQWREAVQHPQKSKSQASGQVPVWMASLFAAAVVLSLSVAAVWLFQ
ncbi:serine/threonine protein kinase [Cohnella panacarvi]|uniref:serine/threonine protein kinase n=1 Tax=Cohnella panacarvi TaxID=400776 RepID=UPI0005570B0F|nr:protein kinase [Cohnella panacarvi]